MLKRLVLAASRTNSTNGSPLKVFESFAVLIHAPPSRLAGMLSNL